MSITITDTQALDILETAFNNNAVHEIHSVLINELFRSLFYTVKDLQSISLKSRIIKFVRDNDLLEDLLLKADQQTDVVNLDRSLYKELAEMVINTLNLETVTDFVGNFETDDEVGVFLDIQAEVLSDHNITFDEDGQLTEMASDVTQLVVLTNIAMCKTYTDSEE